MAMGSTLVIDVTPSQYRNKASVVFTWSGVLGMLCGILLGYNAGWYLSFQQQIYLLWDFVPFGRTGFHGGSLFPCSVGPSVAVVRPFSAFPYLDSGLNMMVVPFILGVLFSSIFDTFFYICIIAGFIVFLLLDRVVRKQVNGRLLNGVGLVLMCVAVWLLGCSTEKGMLMGAGFLTGLGMGFSLLQFLRMMIRLPLHCERGTGYHTYQLLWESGVMLGVFFGKYTEDISDNSSGCIAHSAGRPVDLSGSGARLFHETNEE